MTYMQILTWVGYGLIGHVPNTLYVFCTVLWSGTEEIKTTTNVNTQLFIGNLAFSLSCVILSVLLFHPRDKLCEQFCGTMLFYNFVPVR
jgi:hypothetical protein